MEENTEAIIAETVIVRISSLMEEKFLDLPSTLDRLSLSKLRTTPRE